MHTAPFCAVAILEGVRVSGTPWSLGLLSGLLSYPVAHWLTWSGKLDTLLWCASQALARLATLQPGLGAFDQLVLCSKLALASGSVDSKDQFGALANWG